MNDMNNRAITMNDMSNRACNNCKIITWPFYLVLMVALNSVFDFFADVTPSVSTLGKLKNSSTAVGIEPATFGLLVRCSTN